MSYRLARFKRPMAEVATQRRKRRRKENGKRLRFSHIDEHGNAWFVTTRTGERYTQSDVKKFFGLNPRIPDKFRQKAKERSAHAKILKQISTTNTFVD